MNKALVVNTFKLLLIRGGGAVAGFLVTFSIPFVLKPSETGVVFLFISSVILIGSLNAAGSPNFILRKIGGEWSTSTSEVNKYHSSLIRLIFVFSVVLIVIFYVFSASILDMVNLGEGDSFVIPLVGLAAMLYAFILLLSNSLVGRGDTAKGSVVQNGISQLCFLCLVFFLSLSVDNFNISHAVGAYTVGLLLAVCYGCWAWYKNKETSFKASVALTKEDRKSLFNFWLMLLTSQFVQYAGQFAVAGKLSQSDIALFTVALRLSLVTSFILIAVNLIVAPQIAAAFHKNDVKKINVLALQSCRLMLCIALPLVVVLSVFAEDVLSFFGEEYTSAVTLLRIFTIAQFVNVFSGSVGYILNMTKHERDMRNVVIITGIFSLLTAFAFTSIYGLIGAAWSTALSLIVQNVLAVYFVNKRLGFNTLNILRKA